MSLFAKKNVLDSKVVHNKNCEVRTENDMAKIDMSHRDDFNLILEIRQRVPRNLKAIDKELGDIDKRRVQLAEEKSILEAVFREVNVPTPTGPTIV